MVVAAPRAAKPKALLVRLEQDQKRIRRKQRSRVASDPSAFTFRVCGLFAISAITDTPNTRELPAAGPLSC
jgi:hypothetical protein